MIKVYKRVGRIHGCKVARGALIVSHMLFTDDSYLYKKATEEEARNVLELVQCFQLASGKQVNLDKSTVFFSANTEILAKSTVCSILNVNEVGEHGTYLGLHNILRRNKSVIHGKGRKESTS